jgi:hypothetical protein
MATNENIFKSVLSYLNINDRYLQNGQDYISAEIYGCMYAMN